ncbi:MAG: 3'(2'),5'-bisphosphate nucleotidase CysQ [Gammaproteobacteria bacterium]|nr:3'(2'),5'-bisphosphate nucleotidase CysQ [Pseudomonadales bacterium]MCP5347479.1 3'(2'),5'-bisphosphate nucleotidase CysQ [Pseudomonadales bacterium]
MTDQQLLALAGEIARAAGQEILTVYNKTGNIDVTVKDDNSPLTEADRRAHELIVARLAAEAPAMPILSEESEQLDYAERSGWSRYWLVDPLDGTKEFIKRNGEFTVNIALIEAGQPVLGVVHVPVTGVTYSGLRGSGATRHEAGVATPLQCRRIQPGQTALKVVASRSHRAPELDGLLERLRETFPDLELVSMGSSLKICLVAAGEADLYPRLGPTCEWDTAAAHAVLLAAGGSLVNPQFDELRYNSKPELLNPHFTAIADAGYDWQRFFS